MTAIGESTTYGGSATEQQDWARGGASGRLQRRATELDSVANEPRSARARTESAERRARGLGWFSLALGTAQIVAPRAMARLIGVADDDNTRNAMFAIGLRELASGIGLLSQPGAPAWAWSRVGGDAIDLALLGRAYQSDDTDRARLALAAAAVVGVGVVDFMTGQQLSRVRQQHDGSGAGAGRDSRRGVREVVKSLTVNRPPEQVYAFWRNFENLPRFMYHLESVQVLDDHRSRWVARAPAGKTVEWDAEITRDEVNRAISWRSLENADVENSGTVTFAAAPGGRGTEITVEMRYDPPAGAVGALVARLFGEEPGEQIGGDLRRFKQVLETGEVVQSDASIFRGMHPAQPPADLSSADMYRETMS